eukprot:scaffold3836_cov417-Prasinococcus_capsulatus_cf.AAC.17
MEELVGGAPLSALPTCRDESTVGTRIVASPLLQRRANQGHSASAGIGSGSGAVPVAWPDSVCVPLEQWASLHTALEQAGCRKGRTITGMAERIPSASPSSTPQMWAGTVSHAMMSERKVTAEYRSFVEFVRYHGDDVLGGLAKIGLRNLQPVARKEQLTVDEAKWHLLEDGGVPVIVTDGERIGNVRALRPAVGWD